MKIYKIIIDKKVEDMIKLKGVVEVIDEWAKVDEFWANDNKEAIEELKARITGVGS